MSHILNHVLWIRTECPEVWYALAHSPQSCLNLCLESIMKPHAPLILTSLHPLASIDQGPTTCFAPRIQPRATRTGLIIHLGLSAVWRGPCLLFISHWSCDSFLARRWVTHCFFSRTMAPSLFPPRLVELPFVCHKSHRLVLLTLCAAPATFQLHNWI